MATMNSKQICILVLGLQKCGPPDDQLARGRDTLGPVTYPADLWILREGEAMDPLDYWTLTIPNAGSQMTLIELWILTNIQAGSWGRDIYKEVGVGKK